MHGKALHSFVPPTGSAVAAWGDFCFHPEPDQDNEPCGWPEADHED